MIHQYHKWHDRRHASKVKPLAYLLVEFFLYTLAVWFTFKAGPLWLTIIVGVGLLYYFLTSSLSRYRKVKERQHFYEEE